MRKVTLTLEDTCPLQLLMRKCIKKSSWLSIEGFLAMIFEQSKPSVDNLNNLFMYFLAISRNGQVAMDKSSSKLV